MLGNANPVNGGLQGLDVKLHMNGKVLSDSKFDFSNINYLKTHKIYTGAFALDYLHQTDIEKIKKLL